MPLASAVKRIAEAGLLRSGAAALRRRRVSGRMLVLAYHNVVAADTAPGGDTSLHIPLNAFRGHLDVLQELTAIAPVGAARDTSTARRPQVAITFDDAYAGTIRHALPELARRGLPATVFVPPGFVPGATFWWDDLGRAGNGLVDHDRTVAVTECRGRDHEVRRRFAERLAQLPPAAADLRCATLDELARAVAAGPVTLGSHTWSHPNLARATPAELTEELAYPLAWLREQFPEHSLPAISYPYGLRSPAVETAARDAGYTMGFLVDGGWLPAHGANPFALPRLNVPAGLSADGLALRLSGFFA